MKLKKAVLFDLDGTLIDTIADIGTAMNAVLERHRFPLHPLESYKLMVGWGMRKLVARAIPESACDDDTISGLLAEMMEQYGRFPIVHSKAYPGIPELLDVLEKREIPSAVLSNKPDSLCKTIIAGLFPGHRFRVVQGEMPDVPRKPDPKGALSICSFLKVAPADTMYLGDSAVDVETAHNAGMFSAGAVWGFRGVEELIMAGADVVLDSPGDALAMLG